MKLHLVMPMAGGGTRFENGCFDMPKPLIVLHGHPFFYWATESVAKNIKLEGITFVVLQEHIEKYEIGKRILDYYPDAQIVTVPNVLKGAVLTCKEGISSIKDDIPILFNDCDHLFRSELFRSFCQNDANDRIDAGLLTFKSNKPCYSYVLYDDCKNVIGTIEKEVVSDDAICGAYYFRDKETFIQAFQEYMNNCNYSEYYVSGLYNIMAKNNKKIGVFNTDIHIPFGTPEEFQDAQNMSFSEF
ncbi:glycosyltransferase family 2 protein [Butyrivibrio sp. INlla16]|uniref:glycosyltransferase family 2 protein n=1 Tax=Butyrivibrio sp. INlla16 TaxID=1520807 RepID=UPI0008813B3A|nr:glycosyltransferase family 2 protein [Butyrivibrio sp. INlla16]SDB67322.1 hypothetical protein SAMN02910263_03945 [Butyrivibrio sp. INlla16]